MRKLSKYEKETIINWNEAAFRSSLYGGTSRIDSRDLSST